MKITVDSKSFVEALQWATKNFDGRDDKAGVDLTVTAHGEGSVSHANSTSYMRSPFTVLESGVEDKDFTIALKGDYVQRLAATLDATGPCVLEHSGDTLKLKNKLGNFTIPTFKAKASAAPTLKHIGTADNVIFFDALQRLAKLCDPASAGFYPVLGTVDLHFDVENNRAVMMATDRYTLGEIVVDFTPSEDAETILDGRANLLIPYTSAVLVSPSKSGDLTTTFVYDESSRKFGYLFGDDKIALFSLQDADALAYASLKDAAASNTVNYVQVGTKDLMKALGTISSLVPGENEIYLKLEDGKLVVVDVNNTNQLEVQVITSEVEGEHSVKFIRSVINKAFSPVATTSMNLKWESATSAFVFEPVTEDGTGSDNVFVLAIPTS